MEAAVPKLCAPTSMGLSPIAACCSLVAALPLNSMAVVVMVVRAFLVMMAVRIRRFHELRVLPGR